MYIYKRERERERERGGGGWLPKTTAICKLSYEVPFIKSIVHYKFEKKNQIEKSI